MKSKDSSNNFSLTKLVDCRWLLMIGTYLRIKAPIIQLWNSLIVNIKITHKVTASDDVLLFQKCVIGSLYIIIINDDTSVNFKLHQTKWEKEDLAHQILHMESKMLRKDLKKWKRLLKKLKKYSRSWKEPWNCKLNYHW